MYSISYTGASITTKIIITIMLQVIYSVTSLSTLTLTAYEGDRVYIPCFTTLDQNVNYWDIQGILYLPNDLSTAFQNSTANGITVYYALPQAAGNYSCYTYYGEENTLHKISTVQLLVIGITPQIAERGDSSTQSDLNAEVDSNTQLSLRATRSTVIYIPCVPALGTNEVKLWKIDGSIYPILDLPPYHRMHQGGIICDTSIGSVGSVYQCFSYTREKNTLEELYTIRITLFEPEIRSSLNAASYFLLHPLKIVSKAVLFKELSTHFQFRIKNVTDAEDCKPGDIATLIHTNSTVPAWFETTEKYEPSFSVPSNVFSEGDVFANVLSTNRSGNECANLRYQFRVDINESVVEQHCVPEGSTLCIPLPSNLSGHVVIWPRQPQSDEDCACPIFVETSDISFRNCYCFTMNLTVYDIHILDYHLCWNNLSREKNGTKYLIARDSSYPTLTRVFENQGEIIVQDPDPFPPNITKSVKRPAAACIRSKSTDWSPVLNTQIVIYDQTNDVISNTTIPSDEFCVDLADFPQTCAPFDLWATAFSLCTESISRHQNLGRNTNSTCECLENKLNLTLDINTIESTSFNASFNISCLNLEAFSIRQISNLFLVADCDNCTDRLMHFEVLCAEISTNILVTDLEPHTSYNVSVIWISPADNVNQTCEIVRKHINTLSDNTTSTQSLDKIIIVLLTCSTGIGLLIITLSVSIVATRMHICKKKNYVVFEQ